MTLFVVPSAGFLDVGWTLVLSAYAALDSSLVMGFVGRDSSARVGSGLHGWLERSSLSWHEARVALSTPSWSIASIPLGSWTWKEKMLETSRWACEKIQEGLSLGCAHLSREWRLRGVKAVLAAWVSRRGGSDPERDRGIDSLLLLRGHLRMGFQRVLCPICRLSSPSGLTLGDGSFTGLATALM